MYCSRFGWRQHTWYASAAVLSSSAEPLDAFCMNARSPDVSDVHLLLHVQLVAHKHSELRGLPKTFANHAHTCSHVKIFYFARTDHTTALKPVSVASLPGGAHPAGDDL